MLIGVPGAGVNVKLALDRMAAQLESIGFQVARCAGSRATRRGILQALDRLTHQAQPGDACMIYYFGHGGRARFTDLEGELAEQVFGYVTSTQELRGGEFEAILDVELSRRMSELEARCHNLTVMLDCCYSGELVRENKDPEGRPIELSSQRELEAPPWVREELAGLTVPVTREDGETGPALAVDSHPGIVRLCGASPKRVAFASERSGRTIGKLTEAFLETLEAAGQEWPRLTWASIGHHLRERVIAAVGNEGQWTALAGPVQRRLFSREATRAPGTVSALPDPEGRLGRASLRAGWHQGVGVGDRWGIAGLALDPEGAYELVSEARVVELERNRCIVELDEQVEILPGSPAFPIRVAHPLPVACADAQLAQRLASSAWLALADDLAHAEARVELLADGRAGVSRTLPDGSRQRLHPGDFAELIALLEDWSRQAALERGLAGHSPSKHELGWSWSRVAADGSREPLPESGARLCAGDRVEIQVDNGAKFKPWFVSVIAIDPAGRLRLLNARMPEGIELPRRSSERIGHRVGARRQGIELRWPEALVDVASGPASLLILAARRPMCLAHVVRARPLDDDEALALSGRPAETTRSHQAELAQGCTWARLDFTLTRE